MRIAAVSDIHGNLPALDAVLADIALEGVDLIVNLGDIVSGPLWPLETARRLMALDLPTIRGNHERQLLTLPIERQGDSDAQASRALGDAERAWLAALPAALVLGGGVRCCHGTPSSDLHYLLETVNADFDEAAARAGDAAATGLRAATPAEVLDRLDGVDGALLLCGHSHLPRAVALPGGGLAANPGSVGLQAYDDEQPRPHWVENGDPRARWGLFDRGPDGRWSATLRTTAYDHAAAAHRAESRGRGDWADALRAGRVGRTERQVLGGGAVRAAAAWGLVGAALAAGWFAYGAPGILLALTATVFWLLLQFSRAIRALRLASQAPVGHVTSAVMLNSRLRAGMTMQQVLPVTGSLGEVVGAMPNESYRWRDAGGCVVELWFAQGRLERWSLQRPDQASDQP